ncbi:MAG: receptor -mostly Fe transport [Pedosphaera sp.]|nr:receptor -mostly Fe transport [Pedosphaera sp.]
MLFPDIEAQPICSFDVAAGYQPGGFNASSDVPSQAKFKSAKSWNFELGYKSGWFEDKLTSRATLFYSYFRDYRIYRFNQADPTQAFMVNAERAHS